MKNHLVKLTVILLLFAIATQAMSSDKLIPAPVNNFSLYYRVMGKGTPIIIVHGGPGLDHSYLLPQMTKFAEKHQVVFYDQRGSGKSVSALFNPNTINLNQFIQDLDGLRQTLGYKKFILIGHSWGGMVAMAYAIKYQKHLTALILMNSVPATSTGFSAFSKEYEKRTKPIQNKIENITNSPEFVRGEQPAFNNYCRLIIKKYLYKETDVKKLSLNFSLTTAKNNLKIESIFTKSLLEKNYDLQPQLNGLVIPTLIIHGDSDPIPLWTAKQIAESIPGSKLVLIKKSGHFSFAEKQKEVFSAINDFINENNKKK